MHDNVLFAFALTVFAGLSTGIGSLIAFYGNPHRRGFLSLALGFSAGVMIYVSFVEIFVKAKVALTGALGARPGYWLTVGAFFAGVALMALVASLRLIGFMMRSFRDGVSPLYRRNQSSETAQKAIWFCVFCKASHSRSYCAHATQPH
jgi:zinc transporter ZupT